MKPCSDFANSDRSFWAHVKLISERLGYSTRTKQGKKTETKGLRRYAPEEVLWCLNQASLSSAHIFDTESNKPSAFGEKLLAYLNYRADILEKDVEPNLMNRDQAKKEFQSLLKQLRPSCALPMNKQKGAKRHYAYLTCIINMLTEHTLKKKAAFVDDPRGLITVTKNGKLIRTFSRWMDGAYPTLNDPTAIWEVKEYYGTTTFGSRVADGVYETMLDGEEYAELHKSDGIKIQHYLIVDDYFTWWDCGRSYLCRIIDMLHMGLVDEVLFGKEVITRWPQIVRSWA